MLAAAAAAAAAVVVVVVAGAFDVAGAGAVVVVVVVVVVARFGAAELVVHALELELEPVLVLVPALVPGQPWQLVVVLRGPLDV